MYNVEKNINTWELNLQYTYSRLDINNDTQNVLQFQSRNVIDAGGIQWEFVFWWKWILKEDKCLPYFKFVKYLLRKCFNFSIERWKFSEEYSNLKQSLNIQFHKKRP